MIKLSVILLSLIILLGLCLRTFQLDQNPVGITWDEAALGYNAYSILKTGKDEYGQILPVVLTSFGDYKPAFYTYLIIPFIIVAGLTEVAVRLPSVMAGVATIFLAYLISGYLLSDKVKLSQRRIYQLLVAGLTAIAPLGILFSRVGFETNVALMLNSLAIYGWIRGRQQSWWLVLAAIGFSLSLLTYQSSKMIVPLLIIGCLIWLPLKRRFDRAKVTSLIILGITGLLLVGNLFFGGQTDRLATVNLWGYTRPEADQQQIAQEAQTTINSPIYLLWHNHVWYYTRGVAERYLNYYSPKFLAITGDTSPRHRVPDLGVIPYISVVFIFLGLVYFWRSSTPVTKLILWWWLIAPIPAALARDLTNLVRAENILLPLVFLEAAGWWWLLTNLWRFNFIVKIAAISSAVLIISTSTIIFLDRYFVHAPIDQSQGWVYGTKQALSIAGLDQTPDLSKYDQIIISDVYGQPYIFYLFYSAYDPVKFQQQAKLDQRSVDTGTVRQIDNIHFRHLYWPDDRQLKNSLFVASFDELPTHDILESEGHQIVGEVRYLDGSPAWRIVK